MSDCDSSTYFRGFFSDSLLRISGVNHKEMWLLNLN